MEIEDLKRVEDSFIINTNSREYNLAVQQRMRIKDSEQWKKSVEERFIQMDEKLDSILMFLKNQESKKGKK